MRMRRRHMRLLVALTGLLTRRLAFLWVLYAFACAVAFLGLLKLDWDDGLIRIFESNLEKYQSYIAFGTDFDGDARDVLVVFEGGDFADPDTLTALSDFLLDVQFVDHVQAALSPLALRVRAPDGEAELLVPFPPPPRAEMAKRLDAAWSNTTNLRRLMSQDRQMMLVILPLAESADDTAARRRILGTLSDLADQAAQAGGVKATLSGYPVLRDRMASGLFSDLFMLNIVGAVVGLLVATLTLRSLTLGGLTSLSPVMALLWVLGMLGHLNISINVITITLPVLVLVLATSDALHITIEVARQGRQNVARATLRAVRRVGPACILAAITTALAFAALTLSRSTLISELGRAGAMSTLLSVASVLITETLVLTTAGRLIGFDRLFAGRRGTPAHVLSLAALPALAARLPRRVALSALAVLAVATGIYLTAVPRYSLYENLAADDPVLAVLNRAGDEVAPAGSMHFPFAIEDAGSIRAVHRALEAHAEGSKVLSLDNLRGEGTGDSLDDLLGVLPEPLIRRLITPDRDRAVATLLFEYSDAADTRRRVEAVDAALAADPTLEGIDIAPATGLSVMSSYVSHAVLHELNYSFLVAIVASGVLMALWLRSPRVALIALAPNILPVVLIGAWLVLSGRGLTFAGGLALTVSFGLAVDDTVHVLNRLRLSGAIHRTRPAAIARALQEVAPALVVTSTVLTLGMSGTHFATTPTVVDFGAYAMTVFILALIADLMVLPACLAVFGRRE